MPSLTPDLDVSIAEGKIVSVDASAAIAETSSLTAGASLAVAETSSVEAGLHLRIVTQGTQLLGMDAQIEDAWEYANALAVRDVPAVIHVEENEGARVLLLQRTGLPKAIILHRGEEGLVRCLSADCEECAANVPRRTITVLSVYEFAERAVRLLVCDERLTMLIYRNAIDQPIDIEQRPLAILNQGKTEGAIREVTYDVRIMPPVVPEEWEVISVAVPIDVSTIPDEQLVGSLF